MPDITPVSNPQFPGDPLLNRFFLTSQEKQDKEKGRQILKAFYTVQTSNDSSLNFFKLRNARWIELLLWFKGSQKMTEFLDYMNVADANKSWLNIDTTQTRIAAQFIGTLIESMAKNTTYACVTAIDDGSLNEKEQRLLDALYRMHDVETINSIQQQSGVMVEPPNAYVPDDEAMAKVYFELEDRLPKEIRFEKVIEKLKNDISFEKVMNRKTLFDLTALNSGWTKIERLAPKEYTVRKCVPTNMVYNFFINDTGELEVDQVGEFWNLKVKEFRSRFGKSPERPNGLTEKEIFELAKLSHNKSIGVFSYVWNDNWAMDFNQFNQNRPYDDCSILVLDAEIDFGEDVYYVEKKDAFGKPTITAKKNIPYQQTKKDGTIINQPVPDDTEIIKRRKNTWMRGVYAPYGDKMLYWGPTDIIITSYTNVSKPLSSYTVNIPNNDGEYVPSLGERIMEPLREYQLTKLKRKQLIAKIKPSGIRIDVETARNIELGNGESFSWEEVVRVYEQTGNELWSSKGVDPLQRETPPLSNTVKNDAINDIIGLTNILAGIVLEIRQLIGVPSYRDGSDVGDRTPAKLAEGQNQSSYNVSDYVLNANSKLWEDTFYKICLLHWNDVVKEEPESKEDMLNTRFTVAVKMKATEYQKQLIEADIQRFSQMPDSNGQPLITPKDAIMIREIDNYKQAVLYLDNVVKENRKKAIQDSERLQQQNAEVQQQSAQQAAQEAQQLQQDKIKAEKDMVEFKAQKDKELAFVNGFMQGVVKGIIPADTIAPIIQQLIPNLTIPLMHENKEMGEAITAEAQQQQMQAQQEEEPEDQSMQPQEQMQPQG